MKINLIRYNSTEDYTDGMLFVDGEFVCYTIEDEKRTVKVYGETRIPAGTYDVVLRKEGRFHSKYSKRFEGMHQGMLCVTNAPNYKLINKGLSFQYILNHLL